MMLPSAWITACSRSKLPYWTLKGLSMSILAKRVLLSGTLISYFSLGFLAQVFNSLFYGKMRQRITAVEDEPNSSGKKAVNEKDDLFSHLPVNVSEEGFDIYDGLGGYFRDTVEFEGKKATMEVTLIDLPPILQIQLQVIFFYAVCIIGG
jgi:hypothetical protein